MQRTVYARPLASVYVVPLDAGQEGAAMGVDDGVIAVDEVLELERADEELELDTLEEEDAVELEGIVEVVKEVMDGGAVVLSVLELLATTVEEALTPVVVVTLAKTELDAAVMLTLIVTELEVVVIGRMYPAILVLNKLAVLTKDCGLSVLIKHCPTPLPRAAP